MDNSIVQKYKVVTPQKYHNVFNYNSLRDILVVAINQYISYFNQVTKKCEQPFVIFTTKVDAALILNALFCTLEQELRNRAVSSGTDNSPRPLLKSRILICCSDLKEDPAVTEFFDQPNTACTKYDVVIATTVIQAGVSLDRYFCTAFDLVFIGILAQRDLDQFLQRWRFMGRTDIHLQRHMHIQSYKIRGDNTTLEDIAAMSPADEVTTEILQTVYQVHKERSISFINTKKYCKQNVLFCNSKWTDVVVEKENSDGTEKALLSDQIFQADVIQNLWTRVPPNIFLDRNPESCIKAVYSWLQRNLKDITKKQGSNIKLFLMNFRDEFDEDFANALDELNFIKSKNLLEILIKRGPAKVKSILHHDAKPIETAKKFLLAYLPAASFVKASEERVALESVVLFQIFLDFLLSTTLHHSEHDLEVFRHHEASGNVEGGIYGFYFTDYAKLADLVLIQTGILDRTVKKLGMYTENGNSRVDDFFLNMIA